MATSVLVYSSDNPCPHERVYPEGCCEEHGGRVETCWDCGMEF